jgi:hypothetical protein
MAQPGTFLRAVVCFPDGTGGGVGVAWVDCKYPADANNCVPVVQRQRLCFGGLSYSPGMVWEGYVEAVHALVCMCIGNLVWIQWRPGDHSRNCFAYLHAYLACVLAYALNSEFWLEEIFGFNGVWWCNGVGSRLFLLIYAGSGRY